MACPIPRIWWLRALAAAGLISSAISGPLQAQNPRLEANLVPPSNVVRLRVVSGRIMATGLMTGQSMNTSSSNGSRQERLNVDLLGEAPSVTYDMTTPEVQITYEIRGGDEVTLRCQPKTNSNWIPLEFVQDSEDGTTLTIGAEGNKRVLHGAGLWHLILADPQLCRKELLPLVEILRPEWSLQEIADSLEQTLLRSVQAHAGQDHQAWRELVNQLGDERFSKRQAADRKLREMGQGVMPLLQGLDRRRLDAEQTFRLREILRSNMGDGDEDTAENAVMWLAGDPQVWYTLLGRDEPIKRRVAKEQLERLLAEPVEFDLAADVETRQEQLEAIREKIGVKK
jgi:hypothetical protein